MWLLFYKLPNELDWQPFGQFSSFTEIEPVIISLIQAGYQTKVDHF